MKNLLHQLLLIKQSMNNKTTHLDGKLKLGFERKRKLIQVERETLNFLMEWNQLKLLPQLGLPLAEILLNYLYLYI